MVKMNRIFTVLGVVCLAVILTASPVSREDDSGSTTPTSTPQSTTEPTTTTTTLSTAESTTTPQSTTEPTTTTTTLSTAESTTTPQSTTEPTTTTLSTAESTTTPQSTTEPTTTTLSTAESTTTPQSTTEPTTTTTTLSTAESTTTPQSTTEPTTPTQSTTEPTTPTQSTTEPTTPTQSTTEPTTPTQSTTEPTTTPTENSSEPTDAPPTNAPPDDPDVPDLSFPPDSDKKCIIATMNITLVVPYVNKQDVKTTTEILVPQRSTVLGLCNGEQNTIEGVAVTGPVLILTWPDYSRIATREVDGLKNNYAVIQFRNNEDGQAIDYIKAKLSTNQLPENAKPGEPIALNISINSYLAQQGESYTCQKPKTFEDAETNDGTAVRLENVRYQTGSDLEGKFSRGSDCADGENGEDGADNTVAIAVGVTVAVLVVVVVGGFLLKRYRDRKHSKAV